ncbi:Epa1p-like protein [Schistosoma mansoni]|uniref:Epa1p-like protein n=1 Tax=Schistosoma mansoni TaxID=6183 RepID=UPI00019B3620|nr:Epa1p-like protein [Schistosoma mansoni]|eukprot:XP_018645047.1 Epa1p-like protein [Schistosoma mansoni]
MNKTENMINTALAVDNQLQTEVKPSEITLSHENNRSNNAQISKETSQTNMHTPDSISPEQNKVSCQTVTTEKLSPIGKLGNNRSMKTLHGPQQSSNSKTLSSLSSISISHNSKIKIPQFDGTTTNMPVSPIISSCSNEVKSTVNEKPISKYSNCMSSSMTLKTTNNVSKSCVSNTLNSPEIRRLRTITHSPVKSLANTISNNLNDFKINFISSTASKSSATSPILSKTNTSRTVSNGNCILQSPVHDSKTVLTEKIPKIPTSLSSSSSNSTAMLDSSLKKISKIVNKPKVNSEKLHRRTLHSNQITPPTSVPPPIPPRTTSRSQTHQGKMVILKPKCLSVTNSPYMSTQDDVGVSKNFVENSVNNHTGSSYNNYSLKIPSSPVNSSINNRKLNIHQLQSESLNELNNLNNDSKLSSVSSQWKRPIHSKIATAVGTLYKRPTEHSLMKSLMTSSKSISSSPSSLLSSAINLTTRDDMLSDSSKYTTNKICEQYKNLHNVNTLDTNGMNNEQMEQRLMYPTHNVSNYYNQTVDNTDLHAQFNTTTTTITTSMTPMKENRLIETSHKHQQCLSNLQKYSYDTQQFHFQLRNVAI